MGNIAVKFATEIEELYRLYPNHKEPIAAKRAIAKAIQRLTKEREYRGGNLPELKALAGLKIRVSQYADARKGQPKEFTPYPATWFNKGRYLEDPKDWFENDPSCKKHPDSGLTQWGTCWGCYAEKYAEKA